MFDDSSPHQTPRTPSPSPSPIRRAAAHVFREAGADGRREPDQNGETWRPRGPRDPGGDPGGELPSIFRVKSPWIFCYKKPGDGKNMSKSFVFTVFFVNKMENHITLLFGKIM